MPYKYPILLFLLLTRGYSVSSQNSQVITTGQVISVPIQVTVPFLTIAPDAISTGSGCTGVAGSPNIYSQFWNPAKYAFIDKSAGVSYSYTPWLRKLIGDINHHYAIGYFRINSKQVVSFSYNYFLLGSIYFFPAPGFFEPKEFAIDFAYSRLITNNLSLAIALRYIKSDLTGGNFIGGDESIPGQALSGDMAMFYSKEISIAGINSTLNYGVNISNIGNKISYTENQEKAFIPINLRTGSSCILNPSGNHSISLAVDLNKLLVPSSPIYGYDAQHNWTILHGRSMDVHVLRGIVQSFYDAPGVLLDNGERSVFREELHEIYWSLGLEYWAVNKVAIRCGYFNEHITKGGRKFFGFGIGLKVKFATFDLSYIIPTNATSPLINTFTTSLSLELY